MKEKLKIWIAWHMPEWLVYWCTIRLNEHATSGKYGNTVVPELTVMSALDRWVRK
jgi:hypothetical protein